MKPVILPLFAAVVAEASAIIHPRQSSDTCCFGLDSVGLVTDEVTEDHTGGISLGGPFQQGGFCFDKSTKTIKDTLNHNCFMRAPGYQFQCYAGAVGSTTFDISPPGSNGKSYLYYDNGPGLFYACPVGSGVSRYYNVFSSMISNHNDCTLVALSLYDSSPSCFPANNTASTPSSSTAQSMSSPQSTFVQEGPPTATLATTSKS
ncbi:hypothetical protein GGR50DRAFT_339099 [Xylaria sp. CBS 124048]|nr:hypothetical protein GGR50DRAFT_339099 [Xylaria sp. CBS 124048]